MGEVHAEITLRNGGDIVLARSGHIQKQNIRSITVTAVVDTGSMTLVMGEDMREKLGLVITETDSVILAGGDKAPCGITEPVEICWEDRTASIRAVVMPGEEEVLLGVIPLEEMNLIVDPVNETLVRSKKLKRVGGLLKLQGR
jgi:clan AA aspartic protease